MRGLLLFLVFSHVQVTLAAFSHEEHYRLDLVRQNNLGAFCFYPGVLANESLCEDDRLRNLLDAHINNALGSGLSIAYYSVVDGSILGTAAWSDWNTATSPVAVCLSGAVDNLPNDFVSTCRYTTRDNDFDDPHAHVPECSLNLPQQRVTDGCYTAPPTTAKQNGYLSDRAKDIITIVTTILGLPSTVALVYGLFKWIQRRRQRHREAALNRPNDVVLEDRSIPPATLGATNTRDGAGRVSNATAASMDEP